MRSLRSSMLAVLLAWLLSLALPAAGAPPDGAADAPPGAGAPDASPSLPASEGRFIENLGQWDPSVRFMALTPFGRTALKDGAVVHDVGSPTGGRRLAILFEGADSARPAGRDALGYPTSFILGSDPARWVAGARTFREVVYEDAWPGVDVRYRFAREGLKYDVILGPDTDLSTVRFEVRGHAGLEAGGDRLDILLPGGGSVRDSGLLAWDGAGTAVGVEFRVDGDDYGFAADRRPGLRLVIDPLILPVSTLLGGSYNDLCADMETDAEGDVCVGGTTVSMDYPVTEGAYSQSYIGNDVVVTKLDRGCSRVLWSTYIGGSAEDMLTGIELDDGGDVLVLGETRSTDFPVTSGALQGTIGNRYSRDVYVLRLGSDGSALRYSTFIGGFYDETAGDIGVLDGRAYVAMMTESMNFPYGNIQATVYGGVPVLMVLSPDGARAEHVMGWRCSRMSRPYAMHLDAMGNATIVGITAAWDFPTTPGAYNTTGTGGARGFVLRCDPDANVTVFSSYFGRSYAYPTEVDVDAEGGIYLAGSTMATGGSPGMELTEGAWCSTVKGRNDAFISKMDPECTRLVYSTLVGGNDQVWTGDLEVTGDGTAVLVGWMTDGTGYWVSPDCIDPVAEGLCEGFVFALNGNGTAPVHSTFLGGPLYDEVVAVEITGNDTMLLSGTTDSRTFPTTEGAFQEGLAGNTDIFVSELACLYPPGAPRGLTALGMEGNVTLVWEPPQDDGGFAVTDYLVLRGASGDELVEHALVGNVTTYVDSDVEYGTRYYYSVRAFNGRGLGPASDVASAGPVTVPDPPLALAGEVRLNGISLSWVQPVFTGGMELTGYRLYRGTSPGALELLAALWPFPTEYWDMSIVDRTTYYYEMSSVTPYGESRARASLALRNTGSPTAPTGLDHSYGDLFIDLSWDEVEDDWGLPVRSYLVYRRGPGEEARCVGSVAAPERRFVDADVRLGTVYAYSVAALNEKGEGERSPEHEAKAMVRPSPPVDVAAVALEHAVRITWSPPVSDGASALLEYRVYYGTDPGSFVPVGGVRVPGGGAATPVALLFLHEVVYDGVPRHYRVTAVNAEGESDPSATVATQMYRTPGAPLSPTIVWGDGELALAWLPPDDDGGTAVRLFTLHRRAASEEGFSELATLGATTLGYVDRTARNGIEYTYRLTATNLVGAGPPSLEVSAVPAGAPLPPANVTAVSSDGSVRLTWEAPSWSGGRPLEGFWVLGISGAMQPELLEELGPGATEYVATGLTNGLTYLYAVRAVTEAGVSNLSDIVEGRPVGPPSAPQGLTALWLEDHVYVTWSAPNDTGGMPVKEYRLHRQDWPDGNWSPVSPLEVQFRDHDVERDTTYVYTVCAVTDAGEGPVARLTFTVPPRVEAPADDAGAGAWAWVAGAIVLAAAVAVFARPGRRAGRRAGPDQGGE